MNVDVQINQPLHRGREDKILGWSMHRANFGFDKIWKHRQVGCKSLLKITPAYLQARQEVLPPAPGLRQRVADLSTCHGVRLGDRRADESVRQSFRKEWRQGITRVRLWALSMLPQLGPCSLPVSDCSMIPAQGESVLACLAGSRTGWELEFPRT